MHFRLLGIFLVFATVCSADHGDDGTLRLVQVIFRHGDRNPMNPYPSYAHFNESYWPEGLAQLTKKGKMQQYELGQYLRKRYGNFLSDSYSPYEIFVKSSDVDRTLMSAEANLAGLYPPNSDNNRWNIDIPWQPIPVHTQPIHGDNILWLEGDCPKLDELQKDFFENSAVIKKLREDYAYVFALLSNKTGRDVKNPEDVNRIYDLLFIENNYYPGWPDWAQEGSKTLDDMRHISTFSFKTLCYTPEIQRLTGGPLLKELVKNLNDKQKEVMDKRRKIFMYSGHDTTVAVILHTMGVFDVQIPVYASLIMLELRQIETVGFNDTYHVKILFRNETNREPYVLTVPNCGDPCTLETFNELMKSNIPVDWNKECETDSNYNLYETMGFNVGAIVVASLILFFVVVSSVCVTILKKKKNDAKPPAYPYLHLQMDDEKA